MPSFSDSLLTLTDPTGSLYYHWVLNLSLLVALLAAYSAARQGTASRRLVLATGGLLLTRAIYALAVLVVFLRGPTVAANTVLAVVENSIEAIGVALIVWALVVTDRLFISAVVLFGASMAALVLLKPDVPFALQTVWWSGWQVLLLGWAILALLLRRPADWVLGLGLVLVLLAAHLVRLLAPPASPQPVAVLRLAQLIGLPLLALIAIRRAIAAPLPPAAAAPSGELTIPEAVELLEAARRIGAWLDPERVLQEATGAGARVLRAGVCVVILPGEPPQVVAAVYEAEAGTWRNRGPLTVPFGQGEEGESLAPLWQALERKETLIFKAGDGNEGTESLAPVLDALAETLNTGSLAPALITPLSLEDAPPGALLVGAPRASQEWTPAQRSLAETLAGQIAVALNAARQVQAALHQVPLEAAERTAQLEAELERARAEVRDLATHLHELDERANRDRQLLLEMGTLLETQLSLPPAQAESELAQLRERLAQREVELAQLRERLAQYDRQREGGPAGEAPPPGPPNLLAVAQMAQQLRQPLAIIAGYTHLMANESLGSLDPRQKRFLERTEESVARLTSLLDDLIRVVTPASAAAEPASRPASAIEAIETAISRAGPDMREKRLTLRMEIADSLPTPQADHQVLSEIVSQLLSLACAASPSNSEVGLIARPEHQAAEQNGGESIGLLIRVRSQVEVEHDLSAVRELVEQHGGHMWLEDEAGARVASVLLPLNGSHQVTEVPNLPLAL